MYDAFIISMSADATDIDASDVSTELKSAYSNAFSTLIQNPFNTNGVVNIFSNYYSSEAKQLNSAESLQLANSANVSSANVSSIISQSTVIQFDMDGHIMFVSSVPDFSSTKSTAKGILGSVEKINNSETLIADSVNKRAIIVDDATQRVKWEYNSDRYVIDAHFIPYDMKSIVIDGTLTQTTAINKNQMVMWQNDLDESITIYSGIVTASDLIDFDANLYGTIFESHVIEDGGTWYYRFTDNGEFDWFTYPTVTRGHVIVSDNAFSYDSQIIIVESDGLESPYSGRVIKVDAYGNVIWTFGEGYLVAPRDARVLSDKVVIST